VDERYPVLQNDLPFFHSPDLWRLLVFLLPLAHSLVYCLYYPTVVCSVIICSPLSQLPGNTNLSQKLSYLSSTCDVRKQRSLHEQSQDEHQSKKKTQFPSIFSAVHFCIVNTDCTKLHFDSPFWQNAEKISTSVSFSIRYKYITFAINSNSVLGHGRCSNACKERYNKYFTLKRWGEIGVLIVYTKSRQNVTEGKCKEKKPRTEGNEDICIISNSPSSIIGSILPAVFLLELVCLPHLSQASFGFFGTETTGPQDPTQTQHNINSLLTLFKCRCVQVIQANWGHREKRKELTSLQN